MDNIEKKIVNKLELLLEVIATEPFCSNISIKEKQYIVLQNYLLKLNSTLHNLYCHKYNLLNDIKEETHFK